MCSTRCCDEKSNCQILINCCSKPGETFQGGSERPFTTIDVKNLIFWAAYSVPDLFT